MKLVSSKDISIPKIRVSPPIWIWAFLWVVFILFLVALSLLPIQNGAVRYLLIGIAFLVMLGMLRQQVKGDYLVTPQANSEGLYFQTDDFHQYFFVPWSNVGVMEKAVFPLNSRGLRFEVTGIYADHLMGISHVGNVRNEDNRVFVYTIPQLHDRDKLIRQFSELKNR